MKKVQKKKLLPKHHTGKIRPHKHTSYGSLAVLLLLAFAPLMMISHSVVAAPSADPVTQTNATYAVISGPVPKDAPQITNIKSGTVYTKNDPLLINGTCPQDTLVKIFKNQVFAGAALCQQARFSLSIDIFIGVNSLLARAYNNTNDVSPDSNPVSVRQDVLGVSTTNVDPNAIPAGQFFITSDAYHRGVAVGEPLVWPITISGGQAPYAVSIGWGDGKTDLISRGEAGTFDIKHTYDKPGDGYKSTYRISIKATDQVGHSSLLQLVTIVGSNNASVVGTIKDGYNWSITLRTAWQFFGLGLLAVISFWLGELRQTRVDKKRMRTA